MVNQDQAVSLRHTKHTHTDRQTTLRRSVCKTVTIAHNVAVLAVLIMRPKIIISCDNDCSKGGLQWTN